ncbi:hypothetical protein ACVPOQ_10385 [Staphylococcus aureus]
MKLYSSLETPSISPKETLERELNRKVSGKEIQPTLERIEQKMVQNQHQETPEFKAIQQKMESLQLPTPPIPKTPKLQDFKPLKKEKSSYQKTVTTLFL